MNTTEPSPEADNATASPDTAATPPSGSATPDKERRKRFQGPPDRLNQMRATAVEYGLVAAAIAALIILGVLVLDRELADMFSNAATAPVELGNP